MVVNAQSLNSTRNTFQEIYDGLIINIYLKNRQPIFFKKKHNWKTFS